MSIFEDFLRAMKEDAAVANLGVAMGLVAPLLCVMALFYMAAWWHRWSLVEFPKSMGYRDTKKPKGPMAALVAFKKAYYCVVQDEHHGVKMSLYPFHTYNYIYI